MVAIFPGEAEPAREPLGMGYPASPLCRRWMLEVIFTHGAGVDVHQQRITACRVLPDPTDQPADGLMERQDCGTVTRERLALSDWLTAGGITPVALERTGEYWQPVFNRLAGTCEVRLVHAAHGKRVPRRKTDQAEAGCWSGRPSSWPREPRM